MTPAEIAKYITSLPIDVAVKSVRIDVEPGVLENSVYEISEALRREDSAYRLVDFEVLRPLGRRRYSYLLKLKLIGIAELAGYKVNVAL
jgi:hypothetical protein